MKPVENFSVKSPAPRDEWQTLMKQDPEALPYQSPEWFDCILENGNYDDASRLYELENGRKLLMPLVRRKGVSSLVGFEASPPSGWGMGGLIAATPVQPSDVQLVMTDLSKRSNTISTSIRPNPRAGQVWEEGRLAGVTAVPRLAHVIDLEGGFDHVWMNRIKRKTRNLIRKAAKNPQLVIECDTTGKFIPIFYELLVRSIDRWAEQQNEPRFLAQIRGKMRDPLSKFELIAKNLGEMCRVYVAFLEGEPVASSITLQAGNVNDSRGAMDKELVGNTGANYLLQKTAIEEACNAGCRYYHLGESGENPKLALFKTRFGAEPFSYCEYKIERIPIAKIDQKARTLVKNVIGFKDV